MAETPKQEHPIVKVSREYNSINNGSEPTQNTDPVTPDEESNLSRGLHQRHISLIGIAGAIGTGLFLGLGSSIQQAGPLGALLAYTTIGLVVCAVQFVLGEVTALLLLSSMLWSSHQHGLLQIKLSYPELVFFSPWL